MTELKTPLPARGIRTARRLVLLASTAGLGIAVLFNGTGNFSTLPVLSTPAIAQNVQKPAGFADVVEKVKPAVISVRVKLDQGPQMSSDEEKALTAHLYTKDPIDGVQYKSSLMAALLDARAVAQLVRPAPPTQS